MDTRYLNEITLEQTIDEVQENVFVVLRVTLDAHDVISTSEHLDAGLLRASHHFRMGRQLPHLHGKRVISMS